MLLLIHSPMSIRHSRKLWIKNLGKVAPHGILVRIHFNLQVAVCPAKIWSVLRCGVINIAPMRFQSHPPMRFQSHLCDSNCIWQYLLSWGYQKVIQAQTYLLLTYWEITSFYHQRNRPHKLDQFLITMPIDQQN